MYCRGQLVQLQKDLPLFRRAGVGLAAISYDGPAVLRDFAARKGIAYPLLSDHDSKVIRAFGVVNRRYTAGTLLDVSTEQITNVPGDVPVYGVAYPSVILLDREGIVRWRFVSEADELRLTGAAILERSAVAAVDASRRPIPTSRVHLMVTASNTDAGLGNRIRIGVELQIPSGLHAYAPGAGRIYHGLHWSMNASPCWYQGEAEYPRPQLRHFPFEADPVPVYEGDVRLARELVLKPVLSAADPSLYKLFQRDCLDAGANVRASGRVDFQVCDDRQCFPPQSVTVDWKFHFVPPDQERAPADLRREFEPTSP